MHALPHPFTILIRDEDEMDQMSSGGWVVDVAKGKRCAKRRVWDGDEGEDDGCAVCCTSEQAFMRRIRTDDLVPDVSEQVTGGSGGDSGTADCECRSEWCSRRDRVSAPLAPVLLLQPHSHSTDRCICLFRDGHNRSRCAVVVVCSCCLNTGEPREQIGRERRASGEGAKEN